MPSLTVPLSLPALVASAFLVSLATVAIPGPITLVASRLALARHLSAAIWFLVGVTALDVALFTALAGGAAPVLRRIGALPIVEIVGGIALVWGGIGSLRDAKPRRDPGLKVDIEGRSSVGSFLLGLVVAAGNPHYWIWWVTAGLAFVEAARAHGAPGLAWMLAALVGGRGLLVRAVAVGTAPRLFAADAPGRALVTRGMGVALLLLGLGLVALGSWRFGVAHF